MLLLNSSSVHTVYIWSRNPQLLTKIHEDHNPVLLTQIPGVQTLILLLLLQKPVISDETPTASGEQAVGAANLLEIKHCTLLHMIMELWWFMMYVLHCWTSEAVSPVYHCIDLCRVFMECCSLGCFELTCSWDCLGHQSITFSAGFVHFKDAAPVLTLNAQQDCAVQACKA